MKKIIQVLLFMTLYLSINQLAFGESKIANKVFGSKDCSQYTTKTLSGLSDYVKCKKGLDPTKEKSFFKSLKWNNKKNTYEPNKPCDEYSTKTITGLSAKLKCKKAENN
tara:strand:+ start:77 stop:403 length:327 start_codon:yes stop_codon:yes gene_type:complete